MAVGSHVAVSQNLRELRGDLGRELARDGPERVVRRGPQGGLIREPVQLEDHPINVVAQDHAAATAGLNAGACAASSEPTTVRTSVAARGAPTATRFPLVEPPPTEAQMTTNAKMAPNTASAAKAAFSEELAEIAGAGREAFKVLGTAEAAARAAASAPATWAAERTAAARRGEAAAFVFAEATVPAEATATASA